MNPIATEKTIFASPATKDVFCFSPDILALPTGRLLASLDLGGPGIVNVPGPRSHWGDWGIGNQCRVLASDDGGENWRELARLPLYHARFLRDGERIYLLGHIEGIVMTASDDQGETWSDVVDLGFPGKWHQGVGAYHCEGGYLYLTMEPRTGDYWPDVALTVLRGKLGSDLLNPANWLLSNTLFYPSDLPSTLGIPFYQAGFLLPEQKRRYCGPPGFLESHVVKIHDSTHNLYEDNTVHIWMRQHTGMTNIAAIAKCRDNGDSLSLELVKSPAGSPMLHVPCPGGHMKFHIVYDEISQLYWLVSSQSTDSMTRPELLPDDRYGLPDNERHRLALCFSRNLFDWCFAGMIAIGRTPKCSRHYASMNIRGDDLLVLSRSGDENAVSAHNGNLITLHTVHNFRDLIY